MRYSRAIDKKLLPSLQQQMAKASPVNNCDPLFFIHFLHFSFLHFHLAVSETIPAWVRQAPQEIDRSVPPSYLPLLIFSLLLQSDN
jgi:hypothetical protein